MSELVSRNMINLFFCGWRSLPVVIHLVDDEDLVANLLFVEERVHERNKLQQLLETLPEGNDEGQFVRTPGGVVCRRCLNVGGAGGRRLLGDTSVHRRDFTWTAELQPEQRDEHEHHAEAEQLVDRTFTRQQPGNTQKEETTLQNYGKMTMKTLLSGQFFISKQTHKPQRTPTCRIVVGKIITFTSLSDMQCLTSTLRQFYTCFIPYVWKRFRVFHIMIRENMSELNEKDQKTTQIQFFVRLPLYKAAVMLGLVLIPDENMSVLWKAPVKEGAYPHSLGWSSTQGSRWGRRTRRVRRIAHDVLTKSFSSFKIQHSLWENWDSSTTAVTHVCKELQWFWFRLHHANNITNHQTLCVTLHLTSSFQSSMQQTSVFNTTNSGCSQTGSH